MWAHNLPNFAELSSFLTRTKIEATNSKTEWKSVGFYCTLETEHDPVNSIMRAKIQSSSLLFILLPLIKLWDNCMNQEKIQEAINIKIWAIKQQTKFLPAASFQMEYRRKRIKKQEQSLQKVWLTDS